jgi:hypothetical protein
MALPDRAVNLLHLMLEQTDLSQGALVFVGYSLGGLVVKEVLREAESRAAHDQRAAQFLSQVRGVVFLSTPHFGSETAAWANKMAWLAMPRETTAGMSRNDPHLRQLNDWFRGFAERSQLSTLVMRETKPMKRLFLVVPADSADPGLSPSTPVIPVDEDHDSIRFPRDRRAQVYQHVLSFVARLIDTKPPAASSYSARAISEQIQGVQASVDIVVEQSKALHLDIAANFAATRRENPVVTAEAEQRLLDFRRSRYIGGFDAKAAALKLLQDVRQGSLISASNDVRRKILAWCSRVLAALDLQTARTALDEAKALGDGEENALAAAFISSHGEGDRTGALTSLAAMFSPIARTATFIIATHGSSSEEAVQWFKTSGLSIGELDADGKLQAIQRTMQTGDWDTALIDVRTLTEADYDAAPLLLAIAATVQLAQAVPASLRQPITHHLPTDFVDFPLGTDAASMQFREEARRLYARAARALGALGRVEIANLTADFALWLGLRDRGLAAEARRELEESMADPKHRLRRLRMALALGLQIDRAAVEREIDRETTISGGGSADAAVARLAMAMTRKDAAETAKDIANHRAQLIRYFEPTYIAAIEVEAMARSGQVAEAKVKLSALRETTVDPTAIQTLEHVIDEASGADPVAIRELQYKNSGSLVDLARLADALKQRQLFSQLIPYARTLFHATRTTEDAETLAGALYEEGIFGEIRELADQYPEVIDSSRNIQTVVAWTLFRQGQLQAASTALAKLQSQRDVAGDRNLQVNIAIASGDWSSLAGYVEREWTNRTNRNADELLRAGQLAQSLGSSARSRELIRAAAAKAGSNPHVLLGSYVAATSAGWEDDPAIHGWLAKAEEASGADGPVQRVDLRTLLEAEPSHRDRQKAVVEELASGSIPTFVAANALNRSLVDMYLVPALANLGEVDPRNRALIFAFSGARPVVSPPSRTLALDVTAILTLSFLGVLDDVIASSDQITIAHRTLGWLFEEREKVQFHQPSQVAQARRLKRLIDNGGLRRFEGPPGTPDEEHKLGDDIARYLAAIRSESVGSSKMLVIRPYPILKPGSLLLENADATAVESHFAGCGDVVRALRRLGHITSAEEERALGYLSLHEKPWPHNPTVDPGTVLLLDDLAVNYLQHVNLLERLQPAGLSAFVTTSHIEHEDALISYDLRSTKAAEAIEQIRATLAAGIASGRVVLEPLAQDPDENHRQLANHPTIGLATTSADAVVIDDRCLNRHPRLGPGGRATPVVTSIDVLTMLLNEKRLTPLTYRELLTTLRRAGFIHVPLAAAELIESLNAAGVDNGVLLETAELRAMREANLRVRMTDALQLPDESVWMDGWLRDLIAAIRSQWSDEISDEMARARSTWLLEMMDVRTWSHRTPANTVTAQVRFRAQIALLLMLPNNPTRSVRARYWDWLEKALLGRFREEQPDEYAQVVKQVEHIILEGVERQNLEPA